MAEQNEPFFIVGAQRSGTTMLRLMLNQHSRLMVPFESLFIPEFFYRLAEFGDVGDRRVIQALLAEIGRHPFVTKGGLVPDPEAVLERDPRSYAELIHAMFGVLAQRRDKARWGDKTPSYVLDMDVLWKLFPGCRFIHLVRDGRDVANSVRTLSWGSRDLIKIARDWREKVMLGHKMGEMISDYYLEVRYESLVLEPAETVARICDFLDEPFEEGMLRYHETAANEMPEMSLRWHRNSVSSPNPQKVQSWRHTMGKSDRIVFDRIAGDALDLFGYEREQLKPTIGSRVKFARYALLGSG